MTKNIMIVGFYKVDDRYIGEDAGLKVGDYITKINDIHVSSIDEMTNLSKDFREQLKSIAVVTDTKIKIKQVSKDSTIKYIIEYFKIPNLFFFIL